jgi:hypothetical protein
MRLCGLDITDDCILHLVTRLRRAAFAHQADTLEGALVAQQAEAGLTIPDRIAVLTRVGRRTERSRSASRRAAAEEVWRQREGM